MKFVKHEDVDNETVIPVRLFPNGNCLELHIVCANGQPMPGGKILSLSALGVTFSGGLPDHLNIPLTSAGDIKVSSIIA